MKVGIYDPYLDDVGGGEKYMMSIAECSSKNNSVSVFWDNPQDLEKIKERFGLSLKDVSLTKNIFSPSISTLGRIAESRKYDKIIFLSDGSLPYALSSLYVHIQQPLDANLFSNPKDRLKLLAVKKFFCNSEFTKAFLPLELQKKTVIIYPPVALHPKKVKKENIILHVGRFRVQNVIGVDDYKKQGFMLQAFKEMVDKGLKNWKFVVAVSVNPQEEEQFTKLKNEAKGYPVEFLINKKNQELWDIYSRAKIYWHASGYGEDLKKYPERAEHFGISTVEAMGAGCVPIVIRAGGQTEIITEEENGLLWLSKEELLSQTERVMRDEMFMLKLSKGAQIRAKDFSPEAFCDKVEELIK